MNAFLVMLGLWMLHIPMGLFFAVTGYRKAFKPAVRANVWSLFERLHVPVPARYAVIGGEFFGGLGLMFGWIVDYRLTWLAALGLLPIMAGAIIMDMIPTVRAKNPDGISGWVSKLLCTPESMMMTMLLGLVGILLPFDFHF